MIKKLAKMKSKETEVEALRKEVAELKAELAEIKEIVRKEKKLRLRFSGRQNSLEQRFSEMAMNVDMESGDWQDAGIDESATDQEKFWAGKDGVHYVLRHLHMDWKTRVENWKDILSELGEVGSVLEMGCNIGDNLRTIESLKPKAKLAGVEINSYAAKQAQSVLPKADIIVDSIADFKSKKKWDFVFTRGVLIHINPELLPQIYERFDKFAKKYVMIYENYSEKPIEIMGYANTAKATDGKAETPFVFYRDFAKDFNEAYPHWKQIAQGSFPAPKKGEKVKRDQALVWTLFERE